MDEKLENPPPIYTVPQLSTQNRRSALPCPALPCLLENGWQKAGRGKPCLSCLCATRSAMQRAIFGTTYECAHNPRVKMHVLFAESHFH